jgi:hypothetical protein
MRSYLPRDDSPRSVFSRRTALKLAAGAVPVGVAFMLPGLGNVAGAAVVKPSAGNTGVPVGTALRPHNGDIVVTRPGTVLDSLDIRGFVKIRAANVVVRRCRVRGSGPGTTNTGLIDCNHTNVRNAVIEDCLLKPDYPSVWLTGVIGKEYKARRCNVYNVVDGFGAYNVTNRSAPTNVAIIANYIHDLSYFSRDPNHGNGPTHNDGIQIQGGANVRIEGNNIQTFMSQTAGTQNYPYRNCGQGILAQWNLAPITGSAIVNNWIGGGDAGMYFVSASAMRFGTVSGNRFERTQHDFGGGSSYQIRSKRSVTFNNSLSSNCCADTGTAFYSGKRGGIRYDA